MSDFHKWLRSEIEKEFPKECPRCHIYTRFEDGRCIICGMLYDEEGPHPFRNLVGIITKGES